MKSKKGNRAKANAHPAPTGQGQGLSRREVFSRMRRSVVAIIQAPVELTTGQPIDVKQIAIAGSGFYVDQDGLVVTAGHVLDRWIPGIQKAMAAGTPPEVPAVLAHGPVERAGNMVSWQYFVIPAIGLHRSLERDLGVLRTAPTGDVAKAIFSVSFAATPCMEGDHVATCGYPFGVELHSQIMGGAIAITPSFSQGVVSAILPHSAAPELSLKRFQIHAMISGGNSGGPVFDPYTGKVCGIITDSILNVNKGVVVRETPTDANGAPAGAPIERLIELNIPIGLALAEHAHHIRAVIAEAKGKLPAKPAAP